MKLVSICALFLCILFIWPGARAESIDSRCESIFQQHGYRPFSVASVNLLDPFELEWLDIFFTNQQAYQTERKTYSRIKNGIPVKLKNPFSVNARIRFRLPEIEILEMTFADKNHPLERDEKKFLVELMRKMILATLQEGLNNPDLRNPVARAGEAFINFFGILYFIPPGQQGGALGLHRDLNSQLQSLIVLKRPLDLSGGRTIIAQPQGISTLSTGYAKASTQIAQQWQPNNDINQLSVFDGENLLHGATGFERPFEPGGSIDVRDLLAMAILFGSHD